MSVITGFELKDLSRTESRVYKANRSGPMTVWADQYIANAMFYVDTISVKITDGVLISVSIAGPRRNKDNRPSPSLRGRHTWTTYTLDKLPDWLRPLVADTPKGVSRGR
jgi:hypothetical protein